MKTRNQKIIETANSNGSTATTVLGAAKFILKKKISLAPKPQVITIDQYRMSEWMDHAKKGDNTPMIMPDAAIPGYRRFALRDSGAGERSKASAERANPRKKNLYNGSPKISGRSHQERVETINYRGKFKGYKGSEIYADYQSCIAITRSGRSAVLVTENTMVRRIIAPVGMLWSKDDQGVLVRRQSDGMEYHPTNEDFRAKDFAGRVRRAMADNYKKRIAANRLASEQKRNQTIFDREIKSTRVTLADSRAAGNCVEGSLVFAEARLGMSRAEILDGEWLVSIAAPKLIATGDSRAIAAAKLAFARETIVAI